MKWLLVVCLLLWCQLGNAYKFYEDRLPNGAQVPDPCRPNAFWKGVGHQRVTGGGTRNPFGLDFARNNHVWNRDLCMLDSDGDGKTNGEELGDPECIWRADSGMPPSNTRGLSHPGICEPLSDPKCQARNEFEVCVEQKEFECNAIKEPDVITTTVMGVPAPVPPKDTTYFCQLVDIPTDGEYHLIAVEPIIDNPNVMHHMVLFGCDTDDSEVQKYRDPHDCFQVPTSCNEPLAGWTLGDVGTCINGPYGYRIGKSGKGIGLLQYHWTNVEKREDYKDGSGFKLHYTPKLRQYDGGFFTIGQTLLNIPPQQSRVEVVASCKPKCTKKLVKEPIKLTIANLHMHYLGESGGMELYRNGVKEKTLLWQDSYDYDTPHYEHYDPPVEFRPGDELKLSCIYKSINRKNSTIFGPGTFDEMCFGFFTYYPRLINGYCGQHGEYDVCVDPDKTCDAAKFSDSEDLDVVHNVIQEKCEPTKCKEGCGVTLLTLMAEHPCLLPGPNLPNLLQQLYYKRDEKNVTDFFQRLVSCGLVPSYLPESSQDTEDSNEIPKFKPRPKPKPRPDENWPNYQKKWEPTISNWKEHVEYLKSMKDVMCGGSAQKVALSFWILTLISAIIGNF